ncbi:outer membrane protein assembly factor BamD [Peijinzhouia sedimentorum]
MRILRFLFIILVATSILSSCSKYAKLEKVTDSEVLLEAANEYYENEEYRKAAELYERILPAIGGSSQAEDVSFKVGMANYLVGNYILADYHFRRFHENYGRSPRAEEAFYLQAYSLYKEAPISSLDATNTREAIATMQNFLNRFPSTEKREEATKIIDELQVRLETKAYDIAKLYWDLSEGLFAQSYLEASLVTFENFERDFPDSDYREELGYLKVEAQFRIAQNSIESKKEERLYKAIGYYEDFLNYYPGSKYSAQAQKVYEQCLTELSKISKSNT